MIKNLIRLAVLVVVVLIAYNYFFGNQEEKETAQNIVNEFVDLGKSVGDLIKTEKEKFDAGKYDEALDKIGNFIDGLKAKAKDSKEVLDHISALEEKKRALEEQLTTKSPTSSGPDNYDQQAALDLEREIEELMGETKKVVNEINEQ